MADIQFTSGFYDHQDFGTNRYGVRMIVAKADYTHKGVAKTSYFGMTQKLSKPVPRVKGKKRPHTGSRRDLGTVLNYLQENTGNGFGGFL